MNLILMLVAVTSAFALYVLKYDTRRMEARVQTLERTVARLNGEIALLEAQQAHLARPERIEPMARTLGLAPIGPRQYLRLKMSAPAAAESPALAAGER